MNFFPGKRLRYTLILLTGILGLMLYPGILPGQFYNGSQLAFGKNRVQYHDFFWTYYRFDRFDTYFYLEGQQLANFTSRYASKYLEIFEEKLEYSLENKIQFIIFNKLSDLKETNIGLLSDEAYNTGGITQIIGTKVILYFNGNHHDFINQIRSGIANVILNEMIYGSTITSKIKNSTLLTLPDWYLQGLISYISENWSTSIDNRVRDGIISGSYKKFNRLTGEQAIYAGHSIWKYIADKYGETVIPNIVYMTKISRNVESGFLFVLGISYKTLVQEWLDHYNKKYFMNEPGRTFPDTKPLLKNPKNERTYSQLKVNPEGNYIAYVTNELGQIKVWLNNLETGKTNKIFKSGYKLNENIDYSFPLLAWHPSGKLLSIILEYKGQIYLYYYTLETRKFDKILLKNFVKILDFSYSQNGQLFAMSAVQNGQSDIFIYNIASHTYEQVTKDIYDDLYPHFINKTSQVVFSSNRPNDTIVFERENDRIDLAPNCDLFLYDYQKKDNKVLRRITETPFANEIRAMEYQPGVITYLSDENGIYNRYHAHFDSVISFVDTILHYKYYTNTSAVTDYSRSIFEHDNDIYSRKYAEIIFRDGKYRMFVNDMMLAEKTKKLTPNNTPYIESLLSESRKIFSDTDTVDNVRQEKRKHLRVVRIGEVDEPVDSNKININDYKFSQQSFIKLKTDTSYYALKDTNITDDFTVPKKRNYNVEYSINQLVSQVDFTFLNSTYQQFTGGGVPIFLNAGFNALFKVGVTDLHENYRITGGVRLSVNFDNNEYILSFENLKNRLDKQLVFHRVSVQNISEDYYTKQRTHELHYILKWPINEVISLRGSGILRNDRTTYLSTDLRNLKEPDVNKNWYGLKGELIYDNTRIIGLNLYYGTRYKFFSEYYQLVDRSYENLIVVGFDYRRYTKLHRTFIWANRFAASSSFGSNRLIYYMGGVDNWLFPKFNTETNIADDQNYAYQTLATNMRGFDQNIRNGNSFFVVNSELRFPLFRYFANKPLKSDFFNNFQIVGFGDVGTAWTGWNPYSETNSLFTQIIIQPPITVTIEKQVEPIVAGYGLGLRSRLMGYFVKADLAWGYEDGQVNPAVFYLSLSLDF